MQNLSETLKSYQTIDEENGEIVSKYRYIMGYPKCYRFNGQKGNFNLDGTENIGSTFTIQPIAWRFFVDNLFDRKETDWAEIIFIDENLCVSSILFNSSSVGSLKKLMGKIFYRGTPQKPKSLSDFKLKISSKQKENEKGKYFVAVFDLEDADPELAKEYKEFAGDVPLYCQNTQTNNANYLENGVSKTFFIQPLATHVVEEEVTETVLN